MVNETQRWIEAGKILAVNPDAQVMCPRFLDAYLEVQDVRFPDDPEKLERIMRCPTCGAMNILLLRRSLYN